MGVGSELEVAFAGLHQVCAGLLPLLEDLPQPQAQALGVALALRPGPAPERFAVGAAVLGLLTRAADEHPLLVLIDDAHLLDESSAQALAFAARRLVSDRVALLAALRPHHRSAFEGLPTLDVGPLSLEATSDLLRNSGPSPWSGGRVERFHEATGGNPLAVLELAGDADRIVAAPPGAPLPLTGELLAVFSRRLDDLADPTRRALLLAATDDHDVAALDRACTAAGVRLGQLDQAEEAGLVRLTPQGVEFRHPLVRAAVYGAASAAERRWAHRLLADVVPAHEPDRRGWHLAEAAVGVDEEAASLLAVAAAEASGRGASAVASAHWERAAALTPDGAARGQRLALAGDQAWLAGASARAETLLGRSLALASDPRGRAWVMGRLGAVEASRGSLERARDLQLEAAREVAELDPEAAVLRLADAAECCLYLCDPATALVAAQRMADLVGPGTSPAVKRLAALATGVAFVLGGRADHGMELIRSATFAMPAPGDDEDPWRFRWALIGPLFLREAGPASEVMSAAAAAVRSRAAVGLLPFLLTLVARDEATSTGWADAEAGYAEAIRLAEETGHRTDLAAANAGLAWLLARQGRREEATRHAERAERLGAAHSSRLAVVWSHFARADLEAAEGRAEEAALAYDELESLLAGLGVTDPDLSPGPELVEQRLAVGRREEAAAAAETFLGLASAKGQPWALARAHRAMALVTDDEEARDHFVLALELHDRTPDPFESARTRLAYGAWLRRARQRARAPRAAGLGARDVRVAGCHALGRSCSGRAGGDGSHGCAPRAGAGREPDAAGAPDRFPAGVGQDQQGGGDGVVPQPEDRGVPPAPRLHQARHPLT